VNSARLANFRDFGGRKSSLGGSVYRDRLFRCGQLNPLTSAQRAYLTEMNFGLVVDLRHQGERKRRPVPWSSIAEEKLLTIGDAGLAREAPHRELLRQDRITCADVDGFYHRLYSRLPFDSLYRDLFARAVIALSATSGRVLVYCSAGKDRTGMMAALIQHMLGVEITDLLPDYLESGQSADLLAQAQVVVRDVESRRGYRIEPEVARRLMGVDPSYIKTFFSSIEDRCGSVANYLTEGGVTPDHVEKMRARFVEAPNCNT
jgi:protein tyrosine/serine phosphatase